MTATPNPADLAKADDLAAELERFRGCLARIRAAAFLYAGRPAVMDETKPLARGLETFAVIVRTCDAAAASAANDDDQAAERAQLVAALKRIRTVAFLMAGSPATLDPTRALASGKESYAGLVRSVDAALDVRSADVVVALFPGRARS